MATPAAEKYVVPTGQPIPGAIFYGSSFTVQAGFVDASIIIHDTIPIAGENGALDNSVLRRPIAILKLSPQALKEFSELLLNAVKQYEHVYGEIPVDIMK